MRWTYIYKFIYYRKKAKIINDNYVLFGKMKDFVISYKNHCRIIT